MGRRLRAARGRIRGGGAPLKVLDVTEFWSAVGGGVRTYLEAKARSLTTRHDVEYVIVAPGPRHETTLVHGSRLHAVRGPAVPGSPGYHFMVRGGRVRQILREEQPDVIELGSHYLAPWIVAPVARSLGCPLVGFYHTDILGVTVTHGLAGVPDALATPARRVVERYVRAVYGRCDVTVTATDAAARGLRGLGLRVEVIPLGVEVARFGPDRRDPALRRRLQRGRARPLLLYAGRFAREKELEPVLAGLPALYAATGARLVLVGDGHLGTRLETIARRDPDMLAVLPYERDPERLAALYASCDMYVAPGPYETFGVAAHEAMASGLPVLSVNRGAVAEALQGKRWSRMYRQGDASSFVSAATSLLAEHGAPGTGSPVARSWEAAFADLLTLYRSLPSARSNRPPTAKTASNEVSSTPAT